MEAKTIITLATEVAGVINKVLSKLPDYDQKKAEELYAFLDLYEKEVTRADADFDDLLLWSNRKDLFYKTIIEAIARKPK
jgi:hypothetical protein